MGATAAVTCGAPHFLHMGEEGVAEMYGLIGKMIAVAGQRDTLLTILFDSVGDMPGCLSYIIAKDPIAKPVTRHHYHFLLYSRR